jgi:hypothetical protein
MARPKLTRNDPADIARSVPREIQCRHEPCACGCFGADPWHKQSYRRVVRNVAVHDAPVCIHEGHTNDEGVVLFPAMYEVARGAARLPGRGLATVRCVVRGRSIYADWELVK